MLHEVIVVGAGIAGLRCAQRLRSAGLEVLILDRAGRVGGRCATRRFADQPADYGPLFLHGSDPGFLAALDRVTDAGLVDGWPQRISGTGQPCQPSAFARGERRLAYSQGVNAFPRSLAEGLAVRLKIQVSTIRADNGLLAVDAGNGERFHTRELVLAMALEQSLPFVRMLPPEKETAGAVGLLEIFASLPCLTVIAGYGAVQRAPGWDVLYPENSPDLLLIGNESSKRPGTGSLCLVYQAQPRWSRERLHEPSELWSAELLTHAASRLGAWAAKPDWIHAHRWRFGRLDSAAELAGPLQLAGDWGRLGVAGDLFAPGGGAQAAWRSGDMQAERILSDPSS